MRDIKSILLCAGINFKKWPRNPRIYIIVAIIIIFQYYQFSCIGELCRYYGVAAEPWVFPFFMGIPSMFLIFGGLAMLFYCDAPFADAHTQFLIIRAGRRNWILGQLTYIYVSSFLYTMCHVVASMLMLVPHIAFSWDWGILMRTIAEKPEVFPEAGVAAAFFPVKEMLDYYSPVQAMSLAILLFWLGTAFIGTVIFSFQIVLGRMSGLVVSGVLTAGAYFVCTVGQLNRGARVSFYAPVCWSALSFLDDCYGTGRLPTTGFALTAYAAMAILLAVVSVIAFGRKDLAI